MREREVKEGRRNGEAQWRGDGGEGRRAERSSRIQAFILCSGGCDSYSLPHSDPLFLNWPGALAAETSKHTGVFFSLSLSVSLSLSFCLSLSLSLFMSHNISLSHYISLSLSLLLCVFPCLSLSFCSSKTQPLVLSRSLSPFLSVGDGLRAEHPALHPPFDSGKDKLSIVKRR